MPGAPGKALPRLQAGSCSAQWPAWQTLPAIHLCPYRAAHCGGGAARAARVGCCRRLCCLGAPRGAGPGAGAVAGAHAAQVLVGDTRARHRRALHGEQWCPILAAPRADELADWHTGIGVLATCGMGRLLRFPLHAALLSPAVAVLRGQLPFFTAPRLAASLHAPALHPPRSCSHAHPTRSLFPRSAARRTSRTARRCPRGRPPSALAAWRWWCCRRRAHWWRASRRTVSHTGGKRQCFAFGILYKPTLV